jgi:hypothetical protein
MHVVALQAQGGSNAHEYDGHAISLSGSLAFGGGINASAGIVWNNEGNWRFFISGGPSAGFDASVGIAVKAITLKDRSKTFDPNQYGGWGSSHNIGVGIWDIVPLGGDNSGGDWLGSMGASYYESGGGVSPWSAIPVSYTYQMSRTLFPGDW